MRKDMKLIVTVPEQFTGMLFTQGIVAVLDKCTVEVMEQPTIRNEQPRSLVESGGYYYRSELMNLNAIK